MATKEAMLPDPFPQENAGQPWRQLFRWHFAVLLAIIVFFGAIRWRLADMPLERDEGEYAYAGQLILQGIPPYQLAYNMKLPGTSAAYAVILAMFGQTARGVHLGLLLINAISVILLYVLTARLFGSFAGTIAGASFAFLSTQPGVYAFAAHATHFVVLASLIGLILLLRAEETRRTAWFFWCGVAFGVAFLMKQPGIFFGIFAFLYLVSRCWPESRREWPIAAKQSGAFSLGAALPFALTCALLYRAGVFKNFWFWTFSYARQYAVAVPWSAAWVLLKASSSYILSFTTPWLWLIALVGIVAIFWDPAVRRHLVFILGLSFFFFAAVCPGLYFRPHYFIVLLPAIAILIAIAVTSTTALIAAQLHSNWTHSRWLRVLPAIVFIAALTLAIRHNAQYYFKLSPLQACRVSYSSNPFPEAERVAGYLRQNTVPTDTIMVFGSEPEIYFYSHRHSASGYIYTYSLGEDQPYWPTMQKQMMREIEANHPAYVVLVNISFSWLLDPQSPQGIAIRNRMKQYVSSGFEEVGMVEVADPESHYFWGEQAREHHAPGREIIIFKRKG